MDLVLTAVYSYHATTAFNRGTDSFFCGLTVSLATLFAIDACVAFYITRPDVAKTFTAGVWMAFSALNMAAVLLNILYFALEVLNVYHETGIVYTIVAALALFYKTLRTYVTHHVSVKHATRESIAKYADLVIGTIEKNAAETVAYGNLAASEDKAGAATFL